MNNEKQFRKEIVEELTRLHNIIEEKDNEINVLKTRLADAGIDLTPTAEEWEGNYQSEEAYYNL